MRHELYETRGDRPPPLLVGHDDRLGAFAGRLASLREHGRRAAADVVLSGPRGVGTSSVLHWMGEIARQQELRVLRVSAEHLGEGLAAACRSLDEGRLSGRRWRLSGQNVSARVNLGVVSAQAGVATERRDDELTSSPVRMAAEIDARSRLDRRGRGGVVFVVDDLQRASDADLRFVEATFGQLSRSHPDAVTALVGAGDPSVPDRLAGDAQRGVIDPEAVLRFDHLPVQLAPQQAFHAVVEPARQVGTEWDPRAAAMVVEAAEGVPANLQLHAAATWQQGAGSEPVTVAHAAAGIERARASLAVSATRSLERLDDRELDYLAAVAARGGSATHEQVWSALGGAEDPRDVRTALLDGGQLHRGAGGGLVLARPGHRQQVLQRRAEMTSHRRSLAATELARQLAAGDRSTRTVREMSFPGAAPGSGLPADRAPDPTRGPSRPHPARTGEER